MTVRVLLADDQALVRAGFRVLLERDEAIEVVGEVGDGAAAVAAARRDRPDVVLMDVRMPEMDGIEATRRIAADQALAAVRVIVLTTYELDEYVFEALQAGASGFLLKDTDPDDLRRAVHVVAAGDALLAPKITSRLIGELAAGKARVARQSHRLDVLTAREREIVALAATGASNHDIARELTISPATAKTHISRAMLKLDARDRAQLVVVAYETGLVTPGST